MTHKIYTIPDSKNTDTSTTILQTNAHAFLPVKACTDLRSWTKTHETSMRFCCSITVIE